MDHWLSRDPLMADYIIDTANIVRNKDLGGARTSLARLRLVLEAAAEDCGDPAMQVYLVCDSSVLKRGCMSDSERRVLLRWRDQGLLDEQPEADSRILELAETTGLPVISRDRFRGHRDTHPWIDGTVDRFLEWVRDGGTVRLRPVAMGTVGSWRQSLYAEKDLMNGRGLLERSSRKPRLDILDRLWRCPRNPCPFIGEGRPGQQLPQVVKGQVRCPFHGDVLADAGPRPPFVQVKVRVNGTVCERFILLKDDSVNIGRSPDTPGYSLAEWAPDHVLGRLSRSHCRLSFDGRCLTVTDTSANGTAVVSRKRDGSPAGERRLSRGDRADLPPGAAAVPCEGIALSRSGRRFPNEFG
ncbi:hypothetical protein GCM10027570_25170 [Streptomonospora sediminis]